ncbi:MAG: T9SS type A sorting domain-containing protein [Paludibacter sp.]|nr:T9SS type A sorting domain-containing protein [Paludibacter sp.]
MKKIFILIVAAFLAASAFAQPFTAGETIFLKASGNWNDAGALSAAYFFNNSSDQAWSTPLFNQQVAHISAGVNYYVFVVPGGSGKTWTTMLFARCQPGTISLPLINFTSTGAVWNQSYDQTATSANSAVPIPPNTANNRLFTINGFSGFNALGSWSNLLSGTPSVLYSSSNYPLGNGSNLSWFTSSHNANTVTYLNLGGGVVVNVDGAANTIPTTGTTTTALKYDIYKNGTKVTPSPLGTPVNATSNGTFNIPSVDIISSNSAYFDDACANYQVQFWYEVSYNGKLMVTYNNSGSNYKINFQIPTATGSFPVANSNIGNWYLKSVPYSGLIYNNVTFNGDPQVAIATLNPNGSWGYVGLPNCPQRTDTIPDGKGFAYVVNPAAVSVSNILIQGVCAGPVSFYTGGKYCLVGNPFINAISFPSSFSNIKTAGYIDIADRSTGKTFTVIDNNTIAPYQGIIVETLSGADEQITISNIAPSSPAPALSPASAPARIKIEAANSAGSHYTLVKNSENGSATVGDYDISFFNMGANAIVQLYTGKNDENGVAHRLGLNTVNTEDISIPVGVFTTTKTTDEAKAVTITLTGMNTYECEVWFLDNLSGAYTNLTDMESYSFPTQVSGSQDARFSLIFSSKVPTSIEEYQAKVSVWASEGKINIISDKNIGAVAVYSIDGHQVYFSNAVNAKSAEISTESLPAGIYMVKANGKTDKVIVK